MRRLNAVAKDPLAAVMDFSGAEDWSRRQLEHMGDAIVAVAARQLCQELGRNQKAYFVFAQRMISNANLPKGPITEIEIGLAYVKHGVQAAFDQAKAILSQTLAYADMLRYGDHTVMTKSERENLGKIVDSEMSEQRKHYENNENSDDESGPTPG